MGGNCSSHSDPDTDNKCSTFITDLPPNINTDEAIRVGYCVQSNGEIGGDSTNTASNNKYNMRNFCTLAGVGGDNQRTTWCRRMGDSEWTYDSQGSGCSYNDCNNYQDFGFGCCNGCCGIVGAGVKCKRTGYKAEKIGCCIRDLYWYSGYPPCNNSEIDSDANDNNGTGIPVGTDGLNRCWSDGSRQKTCNAIYRDVTNNICRTDVATYCAGGDLTDPSDTSWISRWTEVNPNGDTSVGVNGIPPCKYALERNLFTTSQCKNGKNDLSCWSDPPPDIYCMLDPAKANVCSAGIQSSDFKSSSGFTWSKELMNAVFEKYRQNGLTVGTLPGFAGYNSFQDNLFSICYMTPGICEDSLDNLCATQTLDSLTLDPALLSWCGCYLPDSQYARYTNQFQITKECTPTCNRLSSIKVSDPSGTNPLTCEQNICIIDDVTVSLAQTNVGGPISFTQICGNCGNQGAGQATCDCTFSGITIAAANSNIGGGINFSQSCGNTNCLVPNPNPDDGAPISVEVDCQDPTTFDQAVEILNDQAAQSAFRRNIFISLIILFIIAIILLLIYFLDVGNNRYSDIVIKRKPIPYPNVSNEVNSSQKIGSQSLFNSF